MMISHPKISANVLLQIKWVENFMIEKNMASEEVLRNIVSTDDDLEALGNCGGNNAH